MFKRAHVSWLLLIIFAFVLMSGGCGGGGGSNGDESPVPAPTPTPEPEGLVRYIAEEGLTVEFDSIEMRNEYIRVTYYVTAEEDNHIKIAHSIYNSQSKIFDADGREFPEFVINFDDVVGIGGQGGEERDIIAGVRTPVVLLYTIAESGYELTTTFPKVTLTINGYTLEFRNIVVGGNIEPAPTPTPTPTPEPEGLVRYIAEEGLTVEFDSIEMRNEYIRVTYYVTAEEDNHIKIAHSIYNSQSKIFDADGREFPEFVINFDDVVGIGGQGGEERDIVAGVRTPVVLLYTIAESGYELTTTFPKVTLTINGYTLEFRNIVVE